MIREPAVAGRFYPADAGDLARQVDTLLAERARSGAAARGCIVPHAGYMYSGPVAGAVYGSLAMPPRIILLGPRHFPQGEPLAILSEGTWRTPLGDAAIDTPLASALKDAFPRLREDAVAHRSEHSLEVQIPFLQRSIGNFSFVPIVIGTDRYGVLEELGHAVAQVAAAQKEAVLMIASSDMNHYESDEITRVKDKKAIDRILKLDPRGLYDTVRRESISMCGYAAVVALLIAAQPLGVERAELLSYATSGDVNGDRNEVVGYAGIILQ